MDIDAICTQIECEHEKALSISNTFSQRMRTIMDERGWKCGNFEMRTEIDKNTFSLLKKPDYVPDLSGIVSMCLGLRLNPLISIELVESAGYKFSSTILVHRLYIFFLTEKIYDIATCNKILEKTGAKRSEFLGSVSHEEWERISEERKIKKD